MSVLFDAKEGNLTPKSQRAPRTRRKEDDLLVFGYACKLFEHCTERSSVFDPEKHLISWMGDETLRIDRYDARLHFTDKGQFTSKPSDLASSLTPEEEAIERQCDEERYMDLHRDMSEYEIQQEEEMKRFQQALQQDGAYNSAGFQYQYDAVEKTYLYPQNPNGHESLQNDSEVYQGQGGRVISELNVDTARSHVPVSCGPAPPTPPVFQEPEPFVPPKELEVPNGMEIPQTAKMQAIIERTAVFVAKQGKQMEILVKAKQSGNRQFDFLLMDNWLNPYYKHVLQYVTEGKYVPEIPNTSTAQTQEETKETKESDKEESEDDSDGEYELHPLLQASLHKKITRSQPSSASSSPPAQTLGNKFSQTFAPVTSGLNSTVFPHDHDGTNITDLSGADTTYDYSMWYPQDDVQGLYVPSAGYSYHPLVLPVPSVADMIPPPPPPPGEGPLEEEWLEASPSVPPLPPPPPPPVPPGLLLPEAVETPGVCASSSSLGLSSMSQVPQPIIPPPPDLQPIVDKLAIYVAKNGPDFESIIIAKNDPRFDFLDPWNTHHSYYKLKKQEAERQLQLEKAAKAQENQKNVPEVSKGPISFSIKTKVPKKPKIEYRTSVIYKQSLEQEESDEDGAAEESGAERQGKDEGNGKKSEENTSNEEKQQAEDEMAGDSLSQQMDSIKAAERIAQNLESESRDKQLQLERRRKASLFISMLKKTNPADELEANESSPEDSIKRTRKFMEARFDFPPEKKIRSDSDGYEDDDLSSGGVGAPPAGSIRVTQDLMAKVLAASKNK